METIIRIDQGDYLEERGGYDWGRTNEASATVYDSRAQAEDAARRLGVTSIVRAFEDAY